MAAVRVPSLLVFQRRVRPLYLKRRRDQAPTSPRPVRVVRTTVRSRNDHERAGGVAVSPVIIRPSCTSPSNTAATAVICAARNAHQISKQFQQSGSFGDAVSKPGQHSLFESRIGFLLSESFFQNFVHGFGFLMSFSARGAIDEMSMQLALLFVGKFAVKIGSEPVVDFVVNGCHRFSPLKRERGEVVCAVKPERGREFRAARHLLGRACFRSSDNPFLRNNGG